MLYNPTMRTYKATAFFQSRYTRRRFISSLLWQLLGERALNPCTSSCLPRCSREGRGVPLLEFVNDWLAGLACATSHLFLLSRSLIARLDIPSLRHFHDQEYDKGDDDERQHCSEEIPKRNGPTWRVCHEFPPPAPVAYDTTGIIRSLTSA